MTLLWSSKRLTVASPSPPVLVAALIGFDPFEEPDLAELFSSCTALGARWVVGPPAGGDLWVVNGRAVQPAPDDTIEVSGDAPMSFRPGDTSIPVVFTQPVHDGIDARFTFDPHIRSSLDAMLSGLGPWLSPMIVQQALMGHLIANGAKFARSTVIHVQDKARLLAVMDFGGATGVATDATPAAIRRADWHLRPASAGFVPSIFHRAPTEDVLWRFATRATKVQMLPSRYLRLPIHLRRVPTVTPRDLQPRHLAIVRELALRPRTFRELQDATGASESQLHCDVGALYLIGAVTCDPMRALASAQLRRTSHALTDSGELSSPSSPSSPLPLSSLPGPAPAVLTRFPAADPKPLGPPARLHA
ncbi:MAG TPA: hypothetical protein VMZ74_04175 [Ramlibacter sp.]|nr:hypothetical protein [Ramlibacter sp.]